ncbi:GHKL domain-containing protein [Bifidobacterium lemurum]|uniref:GHKL domain-containing protein n=1 Tax=Bifidobacterium lemurum TaxID=1603886 RepID=A0A261FQL3_9BIFI|nr:ATP-binding protein [Bifidobacterium lemurum]OZG61429.1 GHKL domain-containing protein [Bifidobacterium lemurum]
MVVEWLVDMWYTPTSQMFHHQWFTFELFVAQMLVGQHMLRKSAHAVARVASAYAVMVVAAAVCTWLTDPIVPGFYGSVAMFATMYVISIAVVRAVLRSDIRTAMVVAICGYAMQHIVAAMVSMLSAASDYSAHEFLSSPGLIRMMSAMVCFSVYVAFHRWYIRKIDVTRVSMSSTGILGFLSSGVLLVTVMLSSYAYRVDHPTLTLFAFRLVSILVCALILFTFGELARSQRLSAELAFVKQMNDMRTNYYELLKDTIETTNVRYHDLKHQVARLRAATESADESNKVLDEIIESVDMYGKVSKTGNAALDVVLTQKSLECARKSIRFTYMVDEHCLDWVSDYDIYSLFGNALDNAIEALERLDDEERRVMKLTGARRGNLTNIHVTNYFDHIRRDGSGGLATLKADAEAHGYGVKSIRMIVERLGGDMTITAEDGIFDLNIVLPKQSPKTVG